MNEEFLKYLISRRTFLLDRVKTGTFKNRESIMRLKHKLECTDEIYYQYCDAMSIEYIPLELEETTNE